MHNAGFDSQILEYNPKFATAPGSAGISNFIKHRSVILQF